MKHQLVNLFFPQSCTFEFFLLNICSQKYVKYVKFWTAAQPKLKFWSTEMLQLQLATATKSAELQMIHSITVYYCSCSHQVCMHSVKKDHLAVSHSLIFSGYVTATPQSIDHLVVSHNLTWRTDLVTRIDSITWVYLLVWGSQNS